MRNPEMGRNDPTEREESKAALPEYLKMYDVSGQDSITEHAFNRYIKDKEQDAAIQEAAKHPIQEKTITAEEKISSIKEGLDSEDVNAQIVAVMEIADIPPREMFPLIKIGLQNPNAEVQKIATEMIAHATGTVKESLNILREIVLENAQKGLQIDDAKTQELAAGMIRSIPQEAMEEKASLIKQGLENPNIKVQKVAADTIGYLEAERRAPLQKIVLDNVRKGLENPDPEVQKGAAEMINGVAYDDNLRISLIKLCLENPNPEVRRAAVGELTGVLRADEERTSLIKLGLQDPDPRVQKRAVDMISIAFEDRKELCSLAIEQGLGEELINPRIYKNQYEHIDENKFSREGLEKTGSGTTILGGELKGKTIIRHIEPKAFLVWQKLYENYTAWQEAGFDYVPIEPIQSYRLNKDGLVDVFSGVLDLNLESWHSVSGDDAPALRRRMEEIIQVLEQLKIKHGHPHDQNFCLRFFRDENGLVDFSKEPRLYMIDFDQAISPNK